VQGRRHWRWGGGELAKYIELLDGGWHVAPAWNSDTHSLQPSKGGRRTGVLATSLDEDGIREAITERRTFAGNAGNGASLVLDANGCWMGVRLQGYLSATFNVQAVDPLVGFETIELLSRGGEAVHSFDCGGETSCQRTGLLDIDPAEQKYIVAVATRTDGKWLVSAPVWLED
jgi:large repetitive protein